VRWIIGLGIILGTALFVGKYAINPLSKINQSYTYQLEQYLSKRLGVHGVQVMVYTGTTPTQNATTVERLIPQKIQAKSMTIASTKREKPGVRRDRVSQTPLNDLPGMSDLMAPAVQNVPDSPLQETDEQREQRQVEDVFYNKEVAHSEGIVTLNYMTIVLFVPKPMITPTFKQVIESELNTLVNPLGQMTMTVLIHPRLVPRGLPYWMDTWVPLFEWLRANFVMIMVGVCILLIVGAGVYYLRRKRVFNRSIGPQSAESASKQSSSVMNSSTLPVTASEDQLVTFFTQGARNQ
jgi:hypothetical protein